MCVCVGCVCGGGGGGYTWLHNVNYQHFPTIILNKWYYRLLIFMTPKQLWEAYSNHTVPLTVRPSVPLRVRCISPIFSEVGIQNLVCGCIMEWGSIAYHYQVIVTMTLTSDLVLRKMCLSLNDSFGAVITFLSHVLYPSIQFRLPCTPPTGQLFIGAKLFIGTP